MNIEINARFDIFSTWLSILSYRGIYMILKHKNAIEHEKLTTKNSIAIWSKNSQKSMLNSNIF